VEKLISEFDLELYSRGLTFVASLSRLFSTSATPLVDSRFAEKLFCASTGSEDLSRTDMSFDALYDSDAGVGVKTFIASNAESSKFEKVAEFTKLGPTLSGLPAQDLVLEVSRLRNLRVMSDASQFGINISRSFYHCLIRVPGKMFVHEEPYKLIDIGNVKLLDDNPSTVTFSDGTNQYRFSRSKTVLFKRFDLSAGKNSAMLDTPVNDSIWDRVVGGDAVSGSAAQEGTRDVESDSEFSQFVVLPLYATSKVRGKYVAERSGINQWNAGGRKRKFGEAYIPVPVAVHRASPSFFPARDVKFKLRLPDGKVVLAKICQDGGKALMSDPNETICEWLFSALDGNFERASMRFDAKRPYEYEDLLAIGRDAVRITKTSEKLWDYELELAELDEFESFVDAVERN
jgi:hypothetical protein